MRKPDAISKKISNITTRKLSGAKSHHPLRSCSVLKPSCSAARCFFARGREREWKDPRLQKI